MYCRNCGKEIPEDTRFCPECGMMVNTSDGDAAKVLAAEENKATDAARTTAEDKAARKAMRRAKRKKIKAIIGAVFGVVVIVLLIMAFAGVFDNAASDLTNGAYGRRDQEYTYVETPNTDETPDIDAEQTTDEIQDTDKKQTTDEISDVADADTANEEQDAGPAQAQSSKEASAAIPVADIHGIYEYDNGETAVMSAEVGVYTDDDSDYLMIEALSYGDRILAEFSGTLEELDTNVYRAIDMDFGTILLITFDEAGMSIELDHNEIEDVEVLKGYYQKTGEIDFDHVG